MDPHGPGRESPPGARLPDCGSCLTRFCRPCRPQSDLDPVHSRRGDVTRHNNRHYTGNTGSPGPQLFSESKTRPSLGCAMPSFPWHINGTISALVLVPCPNSRGRSSFHSHPSHCLRLSSWHVTESESYELALQHRDTTTNVCRFRLLFPGYRPFGCRRGPSWQPRPGESPAGLGT
ncbi:hypothetical protein VTI74DRAFT_1340 [Chaetomium olivicolor]